MGGLWDRSRFANGVSETGARVQTRRCSCVNAGLFAFSQTKRGSVWVALIARARVQACSANNARRRTGRAGVGSELLRARRMLGGRDGPAGASLSRSLALSYFRCTRGSAHRVFGSIMARTWTGLAGTIRKRNALLERTCAAWLAEHRWSPVRYPW